jgi:hypothetical protein
VIIYLDDDFKCHVTNDGTMTAIETDYFDGKCATFVEGYRFIPSGETWTREDGNVFHGEMVAPWKDYRELAGAQEQYEKDLADRAELEAAYNYLLTGGIA